MTTKTKELPIFTVVVHFRDDSTHETKCRGVKAAKTEFKHALAASCRFGSGTFVTVKDEHGNRVDLY